MPTSTAEHRRRALQVSRSFAVTSPAKITSGRRAAQRVSEALPEKGISADLGWQARAYQLVDEVGELGFVSHLTANTAKDAALRIGPVVDGDELDDRTLETAGEMLSWFVGPDGAQDELVRMAVFHMAVGGESILLGSPTPTGADEAITWEFLATTELMLRHGSNPVRIVNGQRVPIPPDAYLQRMHRPRPSHSQLADSPVRRLLPIAEEIHLLDRIIRNSVRGRMNAGGFFVPSEMTWSEEDDDEGGFDDAGDGMDAFMDEFIAHISAPIEDHDSPAAQVPMLFRAPGDHAENFRHIDFGPSAADWAGPMRDAALGRLVRSMDAPPEILEGYSQLNHWTSSTVSTEYIDKYVRPVGRAVARFITVAYLRPMLVANGMAMEQASRLHIIFDTSPLTQRADDAAAARLLHGMGLVDDETVVVASGFHTENIPTGEDAAWRTVRRLLDKAPHVYAPLLGLLPEFEGIDLPELAAGPERPGSGGSSDAPTESEPPQEQPPQPQPDADAATLARGVALAADLAIDRAYERAEARLRGRVQGLPDLRDRFAEVPKGALLATVDAEALADAGTTARDLMDGAFDSLAARVRSAMPGPAGEEAAARLVNLLTAFAVSNMARGTPPPGVCPEGLVPVGLIERVLA